MATPSSDRLDVTDVGDAALTGRWPDAGVGGTKGWLTTVCGSTLACTADCEIGVFIIPPL